MIDHADHCLNTIRETITCHADTTPNVWRRHHRSGKPGHHHGKRHGHHDDDDRGNENEDEELVARYDTAHTCRNYDAIQDWGHKHRTPRPLLYEDFNSTKPHHHH